MTEAAIKKVAQGNGRRGFTFKRSYLSFPYILLNVIFVILPLGLLLGYAFIDRNGNFSLENFGEFFTHTEHIMTLLFSLGVAALTTAICLLLAYPLALFLADSRVNKSAILVLLFILPMWVNSLLRTYALQNLLLDLFALDRGFAAALIGLVYDFFPFMLLPVYTTLVNMDKSYIEASYDLGAGHIATFIKVRLPLSVPGIMSGFLMTFMPVMSTFSVTEMMGGQDINMIGSTIYSLFSGDDWGGCAAFSFLLLIVMAGVMLVTSILGRNKTEVKIGGLL